MANENSAGAVIFRKEKDKIKYLLLHYSAGHWEYVKGHVEKGETEEETLKREAEEETGLNDLVLVPGFRHVIKYYYKKGKQTVSKQVIFFLAETRTKEIKISHEHIGYEWLEFEEAMEKVSFKNSKDILQRANELVSKL